MMILITGAFGQIGKKITQKLIDEQKHTITCLDIKNGRTRRIARRFKKECNIVWGDIRDKQLMNAVMRNQELVIHLAFFLPPISKENYSLARETNIEGTKNILQAAKNQKKPPKIIFTSSVVIYGDVRKDPQPISITQDFQPVEHYGKHKVKCMELIKKSGLDYLIFILGVVPPIENLKYDPMIFDIPPDTKVELIHEEDVAVACKNAIINDHHGWNREFHIAGGKSCQMIYYDFIKQTLETMGIGKLPRNAFVGKKYHCCYMSTKESQEFLKYQQHSFNDILNDMKRKNSVYCFLIRLFRPIIRWFILRRSPNYRKKYYSN